MYLCEECGAVFEEPRIFYDTHGLPTPPYEKWAQCPKCRSTKIDEAEQCSRCGRYEAELHKGRLCEFCFTDLYGD